MKFSVFSTAGLDYNASIFNTALFSTGNKLASLSVGILQDSLAELSETFNAMLTVEASTSFFGLSFTPTAADLARISFNPDLTLINILDDDGE